MRKWNFYTTNEIKPQGWLKRQLEIQANGLSGNLDTIWRDIRDSAWIGGDAEGWERVPYWLDGFIPLAYLLEDDDLIARAKKYIDAIIAQQRPDGWICPCSEDDIPEYDTWAVLLITKVLTVYYECSKDERIPGVIYKTLKNYYELLSGGKIKLFKWGAHRWYEGFIAINLIYERYPEEWLKELAKILKGQGIDYATYEEDWKRPLNKWAWNTHIVNIAMMLKSEAVANDMLGMKYTDKAEYFRELLDKYNGTPVDSFTGDECLSGLSPIQGTELCAIVEQMYSYEHLYAYTGDNKWAERLENIAFNALPATISDDMWAHQYVQMSNQISCEKFPGKAVFRTNGNDAHLFGLEPFFGCCTSNFNQGWPKLAVSTFMHADNTIVNAVPIPATLKTDDVQITLTTEYPFKNEFLYEIDTKKDLKFKVRIPSFAKGIIVDGQVIRKNEDLVFDICKDESREIRISYETKPEFVERPYDLKTVKCGSFVFSLPIRYEKIMHEYEKDGVERKFPYCDYEYIGKSDWNYGYCSQELEMIYRGISEFPFSSEKPPVIVKAKVAKINWGLEDGYEKVCAKVPESRIPVGKEEEVELYPYGCSKLRMTEMPFV